MPVSVSIESVSKRFRLTTGQPRSLKERVIRPRRQKAEEFWALRDISFDIEEGETIGLLGHNGSGKSTLLKLVGGIMQPTSGMIRVRGRLASLLELG
ncbi:MAG TPA: ATP-binding cassette domain-containing protein, partial [Acidimicrobiales bacterium]|nr:ATP-binding cassette domain-containing protein [Acidimicrobiales bacterium]